MGVVPSRRTDQNSEPKNEMQKRLAELGFSTPAPIHTLVAPRLLRGESILTIAPQDAARSATILTFALHRIQVMAEQERRQPAPASPNPQIVVVVPSSGEANRLLEQSQLLEMEDPPDMAFLTDDQSYHSDRKALFAKPPIVLATATRLAAHVMQKNISLSAISLFIVDGVDHIVGGNYSSRFRTVLDDLPKSRKLQFAAFAAKPLPELNSFVSNVSAAYHVVDLSGCTPSQAVQHRICVLPVAQRATYLRANLISGNEPRVIFVHYTQEPKSVARSLGINMDRIAVVCSESAQIRKTQMRPFLLGAKPLLLTNRLGKDEISGRTVSELINFDTPTTAAEYRDRIYVANQLAGPEFRIFSFVSLEKLPRFLRILGEIGAAPVFEDGFVYRPHAHLPQVQLELVKHIESKLNYVFTRPELIVSAFGMNDKNPVRAEGAEHLALIGKDAMKLVLTHQGTHKDFRTDNGSFRSFPSPSNEEIELVSRRLGLFNPKEISHGDEVFKRYFGLQGALWLDAGSERFRDLLFRLLPEKFEYLRPTKERRPDSPAKSGSLDVAVRIHLERLLGYRYSNSGWLYQAVENIITNKNLDALAKRGRAVIDLMVYDIRRHIIPFGNPLQMYEDRNSILAPAFGQHKSLVDQISDFLHVPKWPNYQSYVRNILLGSVYSDGGYEPAKRVACRFLPRLDPGGILFLDPAASLTSESSATPDYKGQLELREVLDGRGSARFRTQSFNGGFLSMVSRGTDVLGEAFATDRNTAENFAARAAILVLDARVLSD